MVNRMMIIDSKKWNTDAGVTGKLIIDFYWSQSGVNTTFGISWGFKTKGILILLEV